jgi:glutathione synthase/RimK-type ligase-like ATP-grasp enzyme
MSREQCLVITDEADAQSGHVPFVAQHLPPDYLVVVDPGAAIVEKRPLTFGVFDGQATVSYDGKPLENINAVWDRRPTPIKEVNLEPVDPAFEEYSRDSIGLLGGQMYTAFRDALWISDRNAVRRAETKSHQLALAAKLGFLVPDTIFTSDPIQAEAFVKGRNASIIKPFAPFGPMAEQDRLVFLSRQVTPDSDINYEQLHLGPAIFQEAVDVEEDLRISVVGNEVYAAAIEADTEKDNKLGIRDWRLSNFEGTQLIEARTLPPDITQKCVQLVESLGLQFGAIDMILDKNGKYWFIEINPNGQWAFVEQKTKQPISLALAQLILSSSIKA